MRCEPLAFVTRIDRVPFAFCTVSHVMSFIPLGTTSSSHGTSADEIAGAVATGAVQLLGTTDSRSNHPSPSYRIICSPRMPLFSSCNTNAENSERIHVPPVGIAPCDTRLD